MNKVAIILDLSYSGYGIVRSLHGYNIPIIGFYNDKFLPESYTKLCSHKIFFKGNNNLLDKLESLANKYDKKPILFLTSDFYVKFFCENRKLLSEKFETNLPDNDVVSLLLDKNKFSLFAEKINTTIPKYITLITKKDVDKVKSLRFPIILKPYYRNEKWESNGLEKAYITNDIFEFNNIYNKVSEVESYLIAQEYIEGKDNNVEYCLVYYSSDGKCISSFTGKKIRQWPVAFGSTATTTITDNDFIKEETIRIFDSINYKGFGSIEYKKNEKDNKFYLIEPTVGRTNQQQYISTLCGINMPLIAYNEFYNKGKDFKDESKKIIYIDLLAEFKSAFYQLKKGILTFSEWRNSLKGPKAYRFLNKKDLGVFLGLILSIILKIFQFLKRKLFR